MDLFFFLLQKLFTVCPGLGQGSRVGKKLPGGRRERLRLVRHQGPQGAPRLYLKGRLAGGLRLGCTSLESVLPKYCEAREADSAGVTGVLPVPRPPLFLVKNNTLKNIRML